MATPAEAVNPTEAGQEVKRYAIAYPISDYTFPTEARIDQVSLDDEHIHLTLTDKRRLSIPLWWIPSVYNAEPRERAKVEVNAARTMLI